MEQVIKGKRKGSQCYLPYEYLVDLEHGYVERKGLLHLDYHVVFIYTLPLQHCCYVNCYMDWTPCFLPLQHYCYVNRNWALCFLPLHYQLCMYWTPLLPLNQIAQMVREDQSSYSSHVAAAPSED